ncbi:MAG: DUF3769 domain-containing protein [Coleofasciculaceae cyanobacterium SM2_3_26]|nr:DUF3769 domain-containing protein [Coleofasciculaceae cyanobacterium SM2_3_26]
MGHFSKRFLDYTAFSLGYAEVFQDGTSPFLFDRVADTRILFFGLTQQVVGPFRVGFRAAVNLETNEAINTVYTLEYSRRTYGVTIQYNPERQTGSFNIRISDFNWSGRPEPFDSEIRSVEGGLRRDFD